MKECPWCKAHQDSIKRAMSEGKDGATQRYYYHRHLSRHCPNWAHLYAGDWPGIGPVFYPSEDSHVSETEPTAERAATRPEP